MYLTRDLIDRLLHPRLLVVGDVILDRYTWGNAERVSPEAPVLVLQADQEEVRLGGAASVASLVRALEGEVYLAGLVGEDAAGRTLRKVAEEEGIECSGLMADPSRLTTVKERFIGRAAGRHPQQILRVDRETCQPVDHGTEKKLAEYALERLPRCSAVLISDYAKGVCSPELLSFVINQSTLRGVPVLVDPARIGDYSRYRGSTLLTPNRAEARRASGRGVASPEEALTAARALLEQCQTSFVLVKLDREGMVLVGPNKEEHVVPTRARQVYDVTGAGDMVLAMMGLAVVSGLGWKEAAELANLAAGVEITKVGVATVSRSELIAEIERDKTGTSHKQVTLEEMACLAQGYHRQGRTMVFTNGCFDLLHVGHVRYLQEAASFGDILIVAVNNDDGVRRLKGKGRPVIGEKDRAAMLAALSSVDYVLVFDQDTPHELLRRIKPDVLVKGGTYSVEGVIGKEIVEAYGGMVRVTGRTEGRSTTSIVRQLTNRV